MAKRLRIEKLTKMLPRSVRVDPAPLTLHLHEAGSKMTYTLLRGDPHKARIVARLYRQWVRTGRPAGTAYCHLGDMAVLEAAQRREEEARQRADAAEYAELRATLLAEEGLPEIVIFGPGDVIAPERNDD